jgi:hypothetical protein
MGITGTVKNTVIITKVQSFQKMKIVGDMECIVCGKMNANLVDSIQFDDKKVNRGMEK